MLCDMHHQAISATLYDISKIIDEDKCGMFMKNELEECEFVAKVKDM